MCVECGCGASTGHRDAGEHSVHHHHPHDHSHGEEGSEMTHDPPHLSKDQGKRRIIIEQDILAKNNRIALSNREYFRANGIFVVNLLSSPGSGKTTLLEETIKALDGALPLAVIEGDQETDRDADRIRALGIPAVQINTGAGCHLDAHQVIHAAEKLPLATGMLLFIENIGNLVCPALFDLGETVQVVLFSMTEGEDKPLKYPQIFRNSDLTVLTKSDLLPHLDFDLGCATENIRMINPRGEILSVSSRTGDGLDRWIAWLDSRRRTSQITWESPLSRKDPHDKVNL